MSTATDQVAASRRASALPPEERRAAIIVAVRPLLIEHGEMVTTKQIACAAGIAEGTIFRVFADKDELIEATLEAALDPEPLESALSAIDDTQSLERQLVDAVAIIQRRVVDVWTLVSNLGQKRHREPGRPMSESPQLVAILAAHPDKLRVAPAAAARMLRALTLSLTHPMLADEPAAPVEIVGTLLHGIGTGTGIENT